MSAFAGALTAVAGLALVGAPHCMGMCGPLGYAAGPGRGLAAFLSARLLGYTTVGALAGWVVSAGAGALPDGAGRGLRIALALVSAGVLLAQAVRTVRAGVVPAARLTRGRERASWSKAVGLGLVTSVLPCGLLAGAVAAAAATAAPLSAALVMAAFATLTSPALGLSQLAGAALEQHRNGRLVVALALALGSVLVVLRAVEPVPEACHAEAAP